MYGIDASGQLVWCMYPYNTLQTTLKPGAAGECSLLMTQVFSASIGAKHTNHVDVETIS
jgi:hypothetical protein